MAAAAKRDIAVTPREQGDELAFDVGVREGGSETTHDVTVERSYFERLSRQDEPPEDFVHRCFEFLLEREPKESILRRFDVSVIGSYFPEFEQEISA
jgi:hypothetical protein